jgi:3-deoxy-D-manno-octulosonic-acid transferase
MGLGLDILYGSAALLTAPLWGCQMWRTGKHRTDWRGRFGHAPPEVSAGDPLTRTLLIHAVSVGEVNLIRGLVAMLRDQMPHLHIVVSTTTDTGTARAHQVFDPMLPRPEAETGPGAGPGVRVVRFPFDFSWMVERFLNAVKPDVVALVENEVWPNFTQACVRRSIPVCILNGRLSERSYRGYRKLGPIARMMYGRLSAVAAQTQAIADRFVGVGVHPDRVQVLDTMKWDTAQVQPPESVDGADALAIELGLDRRRPILVAGSTGPGEEQLLINTVLPTCLQAQLVIVPRKPERFDEVAALDPSMVRWTARRQGTAAAATPDQPPRLFLLDTMGELRKAYALADVVIVGRSFLGLYGSDLMEPIALSKPTIIGPFHADFADVVNALREKDGVRVCAADHLAGQVASLLSDRAKAGTLAQRGRAVILSRQGATQRHVDFLRRLLPTPAPTAS